VRDLRDGHLSEDEALRKYGVRLKATLRGWVAAQTIVEAAVLTAQLQQAQWQLEALHTLID
jgi:hypothetical protein